MKKIKCVECEKGSLEKKKVPYFLYGQKIGNFEGMVCNKCGSEFFTEDQDDVIEKEVRKRGLWGLEKETKARQSGSVLTITIPKKLQEFYKLKKGTDVILVPVDKNKLEIRM